MSTEVTPSGVKWAVYVVLAVIGFIVLLSLSPIGVVSAGDRGVRFNKFSGETSVVPEGVYFRIPLVEKVVKMDVKVQKEEVEASAASKDLQTVTAKIALNFQPEPEQVARLYREVGADYKARVIDPAFQEAIKASSAHYTADRLIGDRDTVKEEIKQHLLEKMAPYGIRVVEVNVVDFDYSKVFNEAIERKVTAEQDALAAKNKLQQVEFEKQATIARAQGEAEAIKIQSAAIQAQGGKDYVTLKWIEAWEKGGSKVPSTVAGQGSNFLFTPNVGQ